MTPEVRSSWPLPARRPSQYGKHAQTEIMDISSQDRSSPLDERITALDRRLRHALSIAIGVFVVIALGFATLILMMGIQDGRLEQDRARQVAIDVSRARVDAMNKSIVCSLIISLRQEADQLSWRGNTDTRVQLSTRLATVSRQAGCP